MSGQYTITCAKHGYRSDGLPCPWPEHRGRPEWLLRKSSVDEEIAAFERVRGFTGGEQWRVTVYGWRETAK